MKSFMERCNKLIHSHKPNIPIYYNGITKITGSPYAMNNLKYNLFDYNTKQDLETSPRHGTVMIFSLSGQSSLLQMANK